MNTTYTLWLTSPTGERLAVLDRFLSLDYRRTLNAVGVRQRMRVNSPYPLVLTLPYDAAAATMHHLPLASIGRDYRLEVWRSVAGGLQELDTDTVWLIQRVAKRILPDGQRVIELGAVPALDILGRRIVAYAAETSQSRKSGPADDLMKAIVRENLGCSADTTRNVSVWLAVANDISAAVHVTKAFARRNVLTVLQELAEASAQSGVDLFFDVVAPTPGTLRFETYAHTRSADHSYGNTLGMPVVVLSAETGTLMSVLRSTDWWGEVTHAYVAGQGAQAAREIVLIGDDQRAAVVPFGRCETLRDARHVATTAALAAEGHAALRAGLPVDVFQAVVLSRPPYAVYGLHWRFGDIVSAEFDGEIMRCRIDTVHVHVDREGEHIEADLVKVGGQASNAHQESYTSTTSTMSTTSTTSTTAPEMETEHVHQQVQRAGVPLGEHLVVPDATQLAAFGTFDVVGVLDIAIGGSVRVMG